MARRDGMICVLFSERPEGTKFTPGAHSWVPLEQGLQYIQQGYGQEYPIDNLPEDLPGRQALLEAGYNSLEAVRGIADYDQVEGIGQKTEQKIVDYLAEE